MKVCLEIKMLTTFFAFVAAILNTVNADLFLKPRDTDAMVGDSTYFDCASTLNRNDINWYHYKLGAKDHEDVCIYCLEKVHPQYRDRIQIERHNDTGSTRLKIKSVRLEDAGVYICEDNGGIGESTSAQLVVLESSPTCTSNIKPDGLLGPNSCNIEPDELHLSCSVSYNGNIPPMIQWREIGTADAVHKGVSCWISVNRMTCNLTMNTDLGLNGASYICETNKSQMTQYSCTSDIIRIIYAKTDKSTKETIRGSGEQFNCSANNSQACSYTWKWFDGVVEEVLSNDSVLTPWKLGWHKCEANCNIWGKQCTMLCGLVQVVEAQSISDFDIQKWFIAVLVAITGIFLLLISFIHVRRYLGQRNSSQDKQPLLKDNIQSNADALEVKSLNSSFANGKAIYGLTILEKEVFVVRQSSNKVEVYDVTAFILRREWNLEELNDPQDIASCNSNQCLYIAEINGIRRVDPKGNGSLINKWSIGYRFGPLSVTHEGNILVVVNCQINEYSPAGELLREIKLFRLGIYNPRHAVPLTKNRIVISFDSTNESPRGILIYSDKSLILPSEILKEHEGEQRNVPAHLCVDSNGSILAIDEGNNRVMQLNTALDFQKELLSSKHGLSYPFRICLDESNGILLVANNSFNCGAPQDNGEIFAFTVSQRL